MRLLTTLILLISVSAQYPVIQVADFTCCTWKLFGDTGPLGYIGFLSNGTTKFYKTSGADLSAWSMGIDRIPILYGVGVEKGRIACRFISSMRDSFGKWHIWGRALNNNLPYITNLYMEQLI